MLTNARALVTGCHRFLDGSMQNPAPMHAEKDATKHPRHTTKHGRKTATQSLDDRTSATQTKNADRIVSSTHTSADTRHTSKTLEAEDMLSCLEPRMPLSTHTHTHTE